jgi:hypothetical protein
LSPQYKTHRSPLSHDVMGTEHLNNNTGSDASVASRLRASRGRIALVLNADVLATLGNDANAFRLLLALRLQFASGGPFRASPKIMAAEGIVGRWARERYRQTLLRLCELGFLALVASGRKGRSHCPKYQFTELSEHAARRVQIQDIFSRTPRESYHRGTASRARVMGC